MITINLLPSEGPGPTKVYFELVLGLLIIAIAAGGIGFYWNYLNGIIQNRNDEITAKKEQVRKLKYISDKVKEFEAERLKLETKLNLIKQLRDNQKGPVILLDQLSRQLPDNVWYENLTETNQQMKIKGKALSMMAIGDLIQGMQDSGYFDKVLLKKTEMKDFKGREVYDFEIDLAFIDKKPQQKTSQP